MERTLVLLKPDALERGLVGEIIHRYEQKHLGIVAMKCLTPERPLLYEHYKEHAGKAFLEPLVAFMNNRLIALVLEGENAVHLVRLLNGATNPKDALPGTIRGDFCINTTENLVHGSDSVESAVREINLWFPETL
ncbi:MAG: nucleoside-diphosphate kinase [Clostridia bacterium]|nr:nucleoside-diphosphate kinase [Clostridia bacterium]